MSQGQDKLYKAFVGSFSMLDGDGNKTDDFKECAVFRNTYGVVFLVNAATKGRVWGYYFARDYEHGWNFRKYLRTGKLIEEGNCMGIKTRYNSYIWTDVGDYTSEEIADLKRWISDYGETYFSDLKRIEGVEEFLDDNA